MTETSGVATELYEHSAELRGFIASWIEDKRCPLPLVDFFLEHDMPAQAECARWCATEPKREGFQNSKVHNYPYPSKVGTGFWFYIREKWAWDECDGKNLDYDDVPAQFVKTNHLRRKTATECILGLLDAWVLTKEKA